MWAVKFAGEMNCHNFRGEKSSNAANQIIKENNSRDVVSSKSNALNADGQLAGFKTNSNILYGLNQEENIGLKIDEHKRRREDPMLKNIMDIDMGLMSTGPQVTEQPEAGVSNTYSTASIFSTSAELALQASRLQ